jgi:hypothetical protein
VRRTVPPSAEIEQLLAVGVGESPRESLSELAKLSARLIIQRAVEDEFDTWLGRARYERRPDYQRGCATAGAVCATGFAPARCGPRRESFRSRSRRSARRPRRSPPSSVPRGETLALCAERAPPIGSSVDIAPSPARLAGRGEAGAGASVEFLAGGSGPPVGVDDDPGSNVFVPVSWGFLWRDSGNTPR